MNEFVYVAPDFTESNYNFWNDNSQISIMSPFNQLYKRDKSKGKDTSSKEMTVIFFLSEPDSEKNKFYRIPYQERVDMLKQTYYSDFDDNDEVIKECLSMYPHLCLNATERALKEEIDSMVKRQQFISAFDYSTATLDQIKTMDIIRSKTMSLYDNYEKLVAKFIKQKSEARVRGGRKRSTTERKLL